MMLFLFTWHLDVQVSLASQCTSHNIYGIILFFNHINNFYKKIMWIINLKILVGKETNSIIHDKEVAMPSYKVRTREILVI